MLKKIFLILSGIFMFFLSPVFAQKSTNTDLDINYVHQFFNQYCDFHESFHSFFHKKENEYATTPLNDWKIEQNELNDIYINISNLTPTSQFQSAHDQFLEDYTKLLDELNQYIIELEKDPKSANFTDHFIAISQIRNKVSFAYVQIYKTFAKWHQKDRNAVNTKEMIQKWQRMENRKKILLQDL